MMPCAWCAAAAPATAASMPERCIPITREQFKSEPFRNITVIGPFNVQITVSRSCPSLELIGDPTTLANVYAAVKNNVLYLSLRPGFQPTVNSRLLAKINACFVNQIYYVGSGNVTATNVRGFLRATVGGSGTVVVQGKNIDLRCVDVSGSANLTILGIKSNQLTVRDSSAGKVNLFGEMVLQRVDHTGEGPLSIYWINSTDIKVLDSGHGRVFLAGVGVLLDAVLSDHAYLDAKYLRVNRAFINTRDTARADVWTSCTLSALATGASNIYFYHDPLLLAADYMNPPGAVIRMTGIDERFLPIPLRPC